ncbi:hypothetical protein BpHYR1_053624 [Brachionus plicatilis]|uniref:Uncharacterized protein n=1 Tax=Brachionus plicatilis TaxID=10195 RepID=A0A3M7PHC5_BRAPC|nr:hypothetical protein BpHYR1_053624 [Brachionus plicatilis]
MKRYHHQNDDFKLTGDPSRIRSLLELKYKGFIIFCRLVTKSHELKEHISNFQLQIFVVAAHGALCFKETC